MSSERTGTAKDAEHCDRQLLEKLKALDGNELAAKTKGYLIKDEVKAVMARRDKIRKLKIYTEPSLLVVDELGYLSLDQQTSNLFYQVISTRHSHKRSTLITTNTAFSDWGNILYNTTIATAIADRLVGKLRNLPPRRRKPPQR